MTFNRRFAQALESLAELKQEGTMSAPVPAQPGPAAPTLDRVLAGIGSLPREALFLGIASDGLPVLLNLHDPLPGPIVVTGEAGAGKTQFLKVVAQAVMRTHAERDVQYGVLTHRAEEWQDVENTRHRVGVFDVNERGAQDFILSLASWAHSNRTPSQSILILVDDLESIARLDVETLQNLRWLLLRGPARRVWPIITMDAERYGQVLAWIEIFRTRIFGRITNGRVAEALGGDKASALDQLEAKRQFTLRENNGWLQFWLPSF
jgi:hypothetical protein